MAVTGYPSKAWSFQVGVQKAIEFKNTGIILNYWRINCAAVDIEVNTTECRVGGYVSKADALAGKKAVHNLHFRWPGMQNPITLQTAPNDYQGLIYAKLIAEPAPLTPASPLVGGTLVSDLPD